MILKVAQIYSRERHQKNSNDLHWWRVGGILSIPSTSHIYRFYRERYISRLTSRKLMSKLRYCPRVSTEALDPIGCTSGPIVLSKPLVLPNSTQLPHTLSAFSQWCSDLTPFYSVISFPLDLLDLLWLHILPAILRTRQWLVPSFIHLKAH
jgi:hypothetical protein